VKKKKTKTTYRIRNWKEYNASLKQRGSLTLWVSDDVIQRWKNTVKNGKRGRDCEYSDDAILTVCLLQEIYQLALRQTEGFATSIFALLGQDLPVPNYSTICRRRQTLEVALPRTKKGEPLHLLVDSTGVKVFGEGEWKVRQHGYTRRRTWRKLHLGIDAETGDIVAAVVTTNNYTDGQILPDLLEQVDEEIKELTGDGAYDKRNCYDTLRARGATATIPPQHNAKIWQHGNSKEERLARDENLRRVRQIGRAAWKKERNYHLRSRAETQMFQLKTAFGDKVSARSFDGQATQLLVRCVGLNRMNQLAKPTSYKI
jgi:Transposase DDE domain